MAVWLINRRTVAADREAGGGVSNCCARLKKGKAHVIVIFFFVCSPEPSGPVVRDHCFRPHLKKYLRNCLKEMYVQQELITTDIY